MRIKKKKKKTEKRQRSEGVGKQEKQAANVDGRKKLARCHPFTTSARADWRLCADGRWVNVPKKGTGVIWLKQSNEHVVFFVVCTRQHKDVWAFKWEVKTRIEKEDEPICLASVTMGLPTSRTELKYGYEFDRQTGTSA